MLALFVVYLLYPTSNHNANVHDDWKAQVVYLLYPTSNHNVQKRDPFIIGLYIFCILHQTTTTLLKPYIHPLLYIFCILHQTTTIRRWIFLKRPLYIFCILHQTTTWTAPRNTGLGCISFVSYIKPQPSIRTPCSRYRCISFVSYIKPQLRVLLILMKIVVYLLYPTSNHNWPPSFQQWWWVVYLLYPTSNHNPIWNTTGGSLLYIFCILHQTTTR